MVESAHPPGWLRALVAAAADATPTHVLHGPPPDGGGRPSAVLLLFGESPTGPDILLTERAGSLASHANQPAFPGGAADVADTDPAGTALREASEEIGLDPSTVDVLCYLPPAHIAVSGYVVTPVIAWWHTPSAIIALNETEVTRAERVLIAELAAPQNRRQVRYATGSVGPAFAVHDMLIWGFTAAILDWVLELGGWGQPWDTTGVSQIRREDLPGP